MPISKQYQDFDAYVVTLSGYIAINWQRLNLTEQDKDDFRVSFGDWVGIYYDYLDPIRRQARHTAELGRLYKEIKKQIATIRNKIKNDGTITLTEEDKVAFRIKSRKPITHHPRPIVAPLLEIISIKSGVAIFNTRNPAVASTSSRTRMPDSRGTIGIAIAYVTANDPPPHRDAYIDHDASSKMRLTIEVATENRVKDGYIITWFTNSTGLKGPESAPVKFRTG